MNSTADWLPEHLTEEQEQLAVMSLMQSLAARFDWASSSVTEGDLEAWGAEVSLGQLMEALVGVIAEMDYAFSKGDNIRAARRAWAVGHLATFLERIATGAALEDRRKN